MFLIGRLDGCSSIYDIFLVAMIALALDTRHACCIFNSRSDDAQCARYIVHPLYEEINLPHTTVELPCTHGS